jgi:hypothetical protein
MHIFILVKGCRKDSTIELEAFSLKEDAEKALKNLPKHSKEKWLCDQDNSWVQEANYSVSQIL